MDRSRQRQQEIETAVADVREIEKRDGVTRDSLERIKMRLLKLAARSDLFTLEDFPPPPSGAARSSCLYRLSEDGDHRFALYVNSANGRYGTPAHNHTTWAVIVGVQGDELNRFYDRTAEGGVREKGQTVVGRGSGVAFLPQDLHSIHIDGTTLNFHMYGLALEQLPGRVYYKSKENAWAVFPPHSDIREARPAHA